ncbi:MAG TPA: phosphatase PAP2 family protein [Candidatus Saccharimonadales bacterium]|nr:phosphatase PAP2 family protein [Candidatus Saccharimonadales bacterium]
MRAEPRALAAPGAAGPALETGRPAAVQSNVDTGRPAWVRLAARRWRPAAALALLAAVCVAPAARAENSFDREGLKFFHQTLYNPTVHDFMSAYTEAGNGAVLLAGCGALALLGHDSLATTGKVAAAATLGAGALAVGIKLLVDRPRPDGPNTRWESSFPSGHATCSFAVATVVARRHPRAAPWAYAAATLVGISRLYLGRHWPTDVLAGAALGYASGRLAVWEAERQWPGR